MTLTQNNFRLSASKVSDEETQIRHIERRPSSEDHLDHGLAQSPATEFDPAAEKRLMWKIDLYVIPTVAILYLLCFIDRVNIGMPRNLHVDLYVELTSQEMRVSPDSKQRLD